ncbi:unnamed protein product [Prorocentrum cordatum]|uniref:Uncharacterized protein n=1 Tax=Prorocentrum cordatum TaxID=2364126 RepID=A0ABN9UXS3_9DINO|nr:unnamed protein product [Polarella glacialis]
MEATPDLRVSCRYRLRTPPTLHIRIKSCAAAAALQTPCRGGTESRHPGAARKGKNKICSSPVGSDSLAAPDAQTAGSGAQNAPAPARPPSRACDRSTLAEEEEEEEEREEREAEEESPGGEAERGPERERQQSDAEIT